MSALRFSHRVFRFVSRWTVGLLYDRRFLRGRWFDDSVKGWRWCWRDVLMQKLIGYNRRAPFPVSHRSMLGDPALLDFHPDDLNNFQNTGCYFQAYHAKITIGRGTCIAPNVGIITENHDPACVGRHLPAQPVTIGRDCWIGMNAVLLPGVTLGDGTVVGALSVVTHSFPEGHCVIAGNPARLIRRLEAAPEAPEPAPGTCRRVKNMVQS